jgi:hypothetical protein
MTLLMGIVFVGLYIFARGERDKARSLCLVVGKQAETIAKLTAEVHAHEDRQAVVHGMGYEMRSDYDDPELAEWHQCIGYYLGKYYRVIVATDDLELTTQLGPQDVDANGSPVTDEASATMREWIGAFTRIGNALGLEGRFGVRFGYEQIEQRAHDARARGVV